MKFEKQSMTVPMKAAAGRFGLCVMLALFAAIPAFAQDARLEISRLDKLGERAENVVEVTADQKLLQVAAKFLSDKNPQEAAVKQLVSKLQGVYVRVFEFSKPGEYSASDLEPIRSQVNGAGWTKIVGVHSKREGQKVDVHLKMDGDNITGLLIVAAEPKELVVVNIVGPIDLEKLSQLEGQFGIPRLDLEKITRGKPRSD